MNVKSSRWQLKQWYLQYQEGISGLHLPIRKTTIAISVYVGTLLVSLCVALYAQGPIQQYESQMATLQEQRKVEKAQLDSRDVKAILAWGNEGKSLEHVKQVVQQQLNQSPLVVLQVNDGDRGDILFQVVGSVADAFTVVANIEEQCPRSIVCPVSLEGKEGLTHMQWRVYLEAQKK